MKIATFVKAGLLLVSATLAYADSVNYFQNPKPHSVYKPGAPIRFAVEDMPDHHGHMVYAKLYKEDGNGMPLQTFKVWQPTSLEDEDQFIMFDGVLDDSYADGLYYVEITVEGELSKDHYRSYTFALNRKDGGTFENTGLSRRSSALRRRHFQ
ncbi:hypothetical protein BJV82DRAFT_614887 [Fennellomyces sp. T-0311]|nr:hypothetical protein BJV82DRAFT_614887 [Fennellomyces sp. T-0311]